MNASKNSRGLLAALLIASAVLFAVGVTLERSAESAESDEPSAATGEESGEAGRTEAEESEEGEESHSEEGEGDTAESEESTHLESEETLLGIDIESPLAVGAGVVVSFLLAALAFRTNNKMVLVVIALFALVFALLDGRELFHLLDEDRTGLAVLAGVIAVLHLAAAGIAAREART